MVLVMAKGILIRCVKVFVSKVFFELVGLSNNILFLFNFMRLMLLLLLLFFIIKLIDFELDLGIRIKKKELMRGM